MEILPVGSQAALSVVNGCLIATIQADLYDDLLLRTRKDILEKVHSNRLRGVIFDMTSVRVMDSYVFKHLAETAQMTKLLGVDTLFVGISAGLAYALVDLEVDTTSVMFFRNMDEAIEYFNKAAFVEDIQDPEEVVEAEDSLSELDEEDIEESLIDAKDEQAMETGDE